MSGSLIIDSNVLVLLVVGAASREYIKEHKNTAEHFTPDDFDLVCELVGLFSELLIVAHIAAETSSLIRQIGNPKRAKIQDVYADLIAKVLEVPVASVVGCSREEHLDFGVTDAIILHLCSLKIADASPTLLTIDRRLANRAASLGYSVIDYKRDYQER